MSWEDYENLKTQAKLPRRNVSKEHKNFLTYKVFNTSEGKELLEIWKDFLMMISANPEFSPNIAYFNEGKKEFVREILQSIEDSKNKEG